MIYTAEVQHMCPVAKGAYHGSLSTEEEVELQAKSPISPALPTVSAGAPFSRVPAS